MEFNLFKETYKEGRLVITSDISYNMREVLKDNIRLIHGQYKTSAFTDGTNKIFYNLIQAFSNMIYRNTDIDTKDINLRNLSGKYIQYTTILKYALKAYLRDSKFGKKLNNFRLDLIREGHLIVKDVDGEVEKVNLLNIIVPPHAKSLQDTGLIEATYPTWEDMQEFKDTEDWEEIEELWEVMKKNGEVYFTVYEYWVIDEFENEKGEKVIDKGCIKYLDKSALDTHEDSQQDDYKPDLEIDRFISPKTEKIKSKRLQKKYGKKERRIYPYKDAKLIEVSGRYWGFGVAELLSGLQEDYNEKLNLKRKFDRLQLRGILVHTKSDDINKARNLSQEFLKNIDTGVAISMENDERIERLNLGSTTFDTVTMLDKLFELMRVIIGVTQQSTGEQSPATTTATVGMLNQQASKTTYDAVIETQSLFLSELFQDFLLEDIIEDLTSSEVVALTSDLRNLRELDRFLVTQAVWKDAIAEPVLPAPQEVEDEITRRLDELEMQGEERFTKIKKEMVEKLDYLVEIYVNNESFDKQTRITNIREMLRDPNYSGSRAALESELRDLIGLQGMRYDKSADEIEAEMQMIARKEQAENPQMDLPQSRVSEAQTFGEQTSNKRPYTRQ